MEASLAPTFASDGTLWAGLLDTALITDTTTFDGISVPNALHVGAANLDIVQGLLDWDALVRADERTAYLPLVRK
jgi:hypothetical protein